MAEAVVVVVEEEEGARLSSGRTRLCLRRASAADEDSAPMNAPRVEEGAVGPDAASARQCYSKWVNIVNS